MKTQHTNLQKPYLNAREASEFLGMSLNWLHKMTSQKRIPHYKPTGKMIYFDREELIAFMTKNRIPTNDEIEARAIEAMKKGGIK